MAPAAVLYVFPIPILTPQQNHLLMVFVATIIALVAQPVRMGVSVIVAITVLALTGILTPAQALSGFSNVTVWLVFTAFLFARAVTITGFGTRVGYLFIRRFAPTWFWRRSFRRTRRAAAASSSRWCAAWPPISALSRGPRQS